MGKGVLIEQHLINNIIELANKREEVDYNRFPNGLCFSDSESLSKALSPFEESETLEKAIDDLSLDQVRELSAVMYLGREYLQRDNVEDTEIENAISLHREDAEKRDLEDVKRSVFEKAPLGKYLSNGIKKLTN